MIFGTLNSEKSWHENLTYMSRCSHFTLGNPRRSLSTVLYLYILLRRKQTVNHLPFPPENVTTLTCELQNFFIWLKVCCVPSIVGCHRWLWKEPVVMCGNWNVRQAMSQQVFRVTPSVLIHASSLFRHWSITQYTALCWSSAHVATNRCHKPQHVHINTRAPPVACPRRSTRAMQVTGSTEQQ